MNNATTIKLSPTLMLLGDYASGYAATRAKDGASLVRASNWVDAVMGHDYYSAQALRNAWGWEENYEAYQDRLDDKAASSVSRYMVEIEA